MHSYLYSQTFFPHTEEHTRTTTSHQYLIILKQRPKKILPTRHTNHPTPAQNGIKNRHQNTHQSSPHLNHPNNTLHPCKSHRSQKTLLTHQPPPPPHFLPTIKKEATNLLPNNPAKTPTTFPLDTSEDPEEIRSK